MCAFFSYDKGLQSKIPYFNKPQTEPNKSVSCEFCQETV